MRVNLGGLVLGVRACKCLFRGLMKGFWGCIGMT